MTRYRLSCTVDTAHLGGVIEVVALGALQGDYPAEIGLNAMPVFTETEAVPEKPAYMEPPPLTVEEREQRAKAPTKKRTRGNGDGWPAAGSIYDTVLQALRDGAQLTPTQLRDVLKSKGFSPGSVNSSLGRLEKRGRIAKGDGGLWAAV